MEYLGMDYYDGSGLQISGEDHNSREQICKILLKRLFLIRGKIKEGSMV